MWKPNGMLCSYRSNSWLWFEQVMILNSQSAHSYYSYAQTERHFGLGQLTTVDVRVEFYPSGKRVDRKAADANLAVVLSESDKADVTVGVE